MDWAEKYRPGHLQDITGNTTIIRRMAEWGRSWTRQSRPLILYGKPGIGKTSSAYALANDLGWDVIELNASDQRTAAVIERTALAGSTTASLTGASRKLIVLDEADNLQGTADRGGAKAILSCIRESRQPIILIANELYGLPAEIRLRCEPLQFKAIPARSIAPRLKYICAAEKISCSDAAIREISESAEGDMRSAVNMLFACGIGRQNLDDTHLHTAGKDNRTSIFTLVSALAGTASDEELLRLSRDLNETPDAVEQWIEGSLPLIVPPQDTAAAYRFLARADEYLGYTYRRQYHTLWRYANALMLLGVADCSHGKGIHARIQPPARWQKMAGAKKQRAIRISVLSRFADTMHIPSATLREHYLSTITLLVENNPASFAAGLQLDADQLNFFLSDKTRSQQIVQQVAAAARDHEKEVKVRTAQKKTEPAAGKEPAPVAAPVSTQDREPEKERAKGRQDAPDEPVKEKREPQKTQSTLFDGF